MKISLITATFNSEKTLSVCMRSVLEQTYPNIEYILVDGNSTDRTLEIIKQKAIEHSNIKFISEKDDGIYDALNKGIKLATGDVIGFVHSDDLLANEHIIQEIANTFIKNNVDGVYGDLHYVSIDNVEKVIRNWRSKSFKTRLLRLGWMPAHPTLFLKSSIYKLKGNFNLNYQIAADYDFVLRIFSDKNYKFYYLPMVFTKMRIGGASNQSMENIIIKTKEDYVALRKNDISLPFIVILLKNISKIPQWLNR